MDVEDASGRWFLHYAHNVNRQTVRGEFLHYEHNVNWSAVSAFWRIPPLKKHIGTLTSILAILAMQRCSFYIMLIM